MLPEKYADIFDFFFNTNILKNLITKTENALDNYKKRLITK